MQELILWTIGYLSRDGNEQFIMQRLHLQVRAFHRGYRISDGFGKSVDRGDPTGRSHNYTLLSYKEACGCKVNESDLDSMVGEIPDPEKEALFRVDYEKFLDTLTPMERRYFDAKLQGLTWTEIKEQRIVPTYRQHQLKMSIKNKLRDYL